MSNIVAVWVAPPSTSAEDEKIVADILNDSDLINSYFDAVLGQNANTGFVPTDIVVEYNGNL